MTSEPTPGVAAWGALLKVHATVAPLIDAQLRRDGGMPLSWYDVLLELNAAPDRQLTMSEVAARATLSRTRISRVIDELVAAGFVERHSNPTDKRSAYATITRTGRDKLQKAAPIYLASIEREFSSHLSPTEAATIAAALWRVHAATA
ncbi:MAG TPA: MarR family transcriptional regulator [Microlunatus sp.]|nr:MarR family transcriptional regulator [Microlunatus sp.]